jgi:energy-coupling factor transporter ATP-binding protein EcfA2
MELTLRNVGIIAEARIKLNGLTVVTGANNSGKTTVGRALYSLVSAVENLQRNALLDKLAYAQFTIDNLLSDFAYDWPTFFNKVEAVDTGRTPSVEEIGAYIDQVIVWVSETEKDSFEQGMKPRVLSPRSKFLVEKLFQEFSRRRTDIVSNLKSLRNAILKDPELVEYANKRIEKKVNAEFFGQIATLSTQTTGTPECVMSEGDKVFFNVVFDNLSDKKRYHPSASPFVGAFFIDDGCIVDELTGKKDRDDRGGRFSRYRSRYPSLAANSKDFLESFSVGGHKDDLIRNLLSQQSTITGELAVEEQTAAVIGIIRKAVAFGIEWKDGRFVSSDLKIDLRNLAQGSKAFLIIKLLLENGVLRKDSVLVLDEPETRLHPEWQTLFAEVIVLLVKHLECVVLLTTHSPDFVIALDVASREQELCERTEFYISRKLENGLVTFDEVDDEADGRTMNDVYLHLSKQFMKLEPRRLELIRIEQEKEGANE